MNYIKPVYFPNYFGGVFRTLLQDNLLWINIGFENLHPNNDCVRKHINVLITDELVVYDVRW